MKTTKKKITDVGTILMLISAITLLLIYINIDKKGVTEDKVIPKHSIPSVKSNMMYEAVSANTYIDDTDSSIVIVDENTDVESKVDEVDTCGDNNSPLYHDCIHVCSPEGYDTSMITYMDYRAITSTVSDQYKLQSQAYTDSNTGIRMVNGRYCIAIGSYYTTTVGTYIDVYLSNGSMIPCIVADCKADVDTDTNNHQIDNAGGIIEFVVDTDILSSVSNYEYTTGNCTTIYEWWNSPVRYCMVFPYGATIE